LPGALTGLTRVRRFQQDDAHIFCSIDQITQEIDQCLAFMRHVYGIFGFEFHLELSTRPEKFIGNVEVWDQAEKSLEEALKQFGQPWRLNPGDGAFYGPKIDIHIYDALKRSHQCATIQLDFNLPERFKLEYQSEGEGGVKTKRPVIIHRAILGSVERMIANLTEHTGGKWPFWVSPRQVIVVPVTENQLPYARKVHDLIHDAGFYVDIDSSDKTLNKKIFEGQSNQYNFVLVVGKAEEEAGSVNVRLREGGVQGTVSIADIIRQFADLQSSKK